MSNEKWKMILSSLFRSLVHISRFGLAALFLFTAGAKLLILKTFATSVASLLSSASINYERWQWPATTSVIAAEIIAALLLLIPRTVRLGAIVGALLLVGFSAFALYYRSEEHTSELQSQ